MKVRNLLMGGVVCTLMLFIILSCQDEKVYPEVRLFQPVLNKPLESQGNSIIVNMGKLKRAMSYTIELSRDTFKTMDYTIEVDTNYIVIDDNFLSGDPLFWNTLYQVQATAHAAEEKFDSKPSFLGSVKTEVFPSALEKPASYDVTDVAAFVHWKLSNEGLPKITTIKVFAASDLKLKTPLASFEISLEDQTIGQTYITGLSASTKYQIAIYDANGLRGWVDYETLEADINPADPGVVDLRDAIDPQAVETAVANAADGSIILLKRGAIFDMPIIALNKNITIQAAHGFGKQRAMLKNTFGNWNLASGTNLDHVRFVDLELRGNNFGGTYVFNPSSGNTVVNEVLFDNCYINTMRGIMRMRGSNAEINNFRIINCVVDSIGGYGLFTADTDGPSATTAHVNNFEFKNSTFNRFTAGITSRTNTQSIVIDGCTFASFVQGNTGNYLFRYRGAAPENQIVNGVTITNSIFGSGWDIGDGKVNIQGFQGNAGTAFSTTNVFTTSIFTFTAGSEIGAMPIGNYAGNPNSLWKDPAKNDFNIKDTSFPGRYSAGDPRWRLKL